MKFTCSSAYACYRYILCKHATISWWRHQMETLSALLAISAGNSPVTGEFPQKRRWRGALVLSFIFAWINAWVNNCETGDLRRHRAHYDAIVMILHCYVYCYYGYYYGYEKGNLPVTYKSTGSRPFFLDYRVSLMTVCPGRMLHAHVA